jgi:6-phosphogluconolactonase (cycloisomerase 2 family)
MFLQNLDVSQDGKYLAVMTELESYIKVWDLETRTEFELLSCVMILKMDLQDTQLA